jgi:sugar O-acyltransferase (sialic acid O-acetyltransferase NeuD family)
MVDVIIFGVKENSEVLAYYIKKDSGKRLIGFVVDGEYVQEDEFYGHPVIAYEDLKFNERKGDLELMAPLSPVGMNKKREMVFNRLKQDGFKLGSYISSKAIVCTDCIGENSFVLEGNVLQPFVTVGNNVLLWSGNHIGHHTTISDHVMITSHVVVSGRCKIGSYSYLGVNSTVRDGLNVAEGTFLTMGACLNVDTEPWSVYRGEVAEKTKIPSTRMKI